MWKVVCDPCRKMQGNTYADIVGELSKEAPTFAFWGWKKNSGINYFKTLEILMEGVKLTGLLREEVKMIISMVLCAVQELVLMTIYPNISREQLPEG